MTFTGMSQWMGRIFAVAVAGSLLIAASSVQAQEESKVSFSASVDIVSQYFFRGIQQEDSGLIIQPGADVTFALSDTVDLTVGVWNSLHSNQTGYDVDADVEANNGGIWYEADFYAGLAIAATDKIGLGIDYISYAYPDGGYGSVGEIDFSISYDDSDMLGLSPYLVWGVEVQDSNVADSSKQYTEIGVGKDFTLIASETAPVTLSVPLTVGMGFDGFYTDENGGTEQLGFISIGAVASMPFTAIPAAYGDWEVYCGVDVLYLAADSVKLGGDDFAFAGKIGVSMGF